MSQSSDDAPTGPIGGRAQQTPEPGTVRIRSLGAEPTRRWNLIADLTAVALVVVAAFLPWNLYFGVGVPGSNTTLFVVLLVVTALSVASVGVAGKWRSLAGGWWRLRLALNAPYIGLVLAFVAFDVYETIRFAGTVNVPGGVGPGAWLGIAGCLSAAGAPITGPGTEHDTIRSARIIGYASMAGAVLSFCFNLYWRVRYALHSTGGTIDFGKQNIAVIVTAVVYGVVALIAVLAASRWLLRSTKAARLATVALGASTMLAGLIVWVLPVGRDIDAFHGIAQNTSTAGVGFEGFLAWAAAAAIFAPRALSGYRNPSATDEDAWRGAARTGLALIALWGLGSMAMRITDLGVAVSLNYPYSRYDSVVLAAFDLITAVLAIWLRTNLVHDGLRPRLVTALCGLVATLSVARVVVGVALAPRFADSPNSPELHPVYGNNLAQQITSVFDVALCGLGLSILAAAIVTGRLSALRQRQRRRAARARAAAAGARPPAPRARVQVGRSAKPSAAPTTRIPAGAQPDSPTTEIPQLAGAPRIFRGDDSATGEIPVQQPRIYRPPHG
ncbi:hypothetical protein MSAS_42650 [Mycobacterium saskatchewanense]|uniref:DUF7937 domain-containing protein n=1 Tax=Mycobacterium saskatchewanense TaxID=220927 RepID=A0AAJ3TSI5_9MYCO|nr:hypothetical protein AWC23_26785 [Mycobacterium saskatchewanense]BBX65091.1 hypothetical protein MSAS_42650 [Mycobacterium saskatchewanense]